VEFLELATLDRGASRPVYSAPTDWRALRTPEHLHIVDLEGAVRLLYDLQADPLAMENLAGRLWAQVMHAALLARLHVEANLLGGSALLKGGEYHGLGRPAARCLHRHGLLSALPRRRDRVQAAGRLHAAGAS
jgi:hypothetical protein